MAFDTYCHHFSLGQQKREKPSPFQSGFVCNFNQHDFMILWFFINHVRLAFFVPLPRVPLGFAQPCRSEGLKKEIIIYITKTQHVDEKLIERWYKLGNDIILNGHFNRETKWGWVRGYPLNFLESWWWIFGRKLSSPNPINQKPFYSMGMAMHCHPLATLHIFYCLPNPVSKQTPFLYLVTTESKSTNTPQIKKTDRKC